VVGTGYHYPVLGCILGLNSTVGAKFCLFSWSPKILSAVTDPGLPAAREFPQVLEKCFPRPKTYYQISISFTFEDIYI